MAYQNTGIPQYPHQDFDKHGDYREMQDFISKHEGPGAHIIGAWLHANLKPTSVLDLGCGSGVYLKPFENEGCTVRGVDACIDAGKDIKRSNFLMHDLRFPLPFKRQYDLIIFMEVGEHIPLLWSTTLVDHIAQCAHDHTSVLVSWATPGQGGYDHCNEQTVEWTKDLFRMRGGFTEHELAEEWRQFAGSQNLAAEGPGPWPEGTPMGLPGWARTNSFLLKKGF